MPPLITRHYMVMVPNPGPLASTCIGRVFALEYLVPMIAAHQVLQKSVDHPFFSKSVIQLQKGT